MEQVCVVPWHHPFKDEMQWTLGVLFLIVSVAPSQKLAVNFASRLDTMDLGTPWSWTTSLRKSHVTFLEVMPVPVGIRCMHCEGGRSRLIDSCDLWTWVGGSMKSIPIDAAKVNLALGECRSSLGF